MGTRSIPTPSTAEQPPATAPPPRPWWDPVRFARRSVFPALLQAVALGVLLFMIVAGWGLHGVEGIDVEGALMYTNIATFGFWVIWFMALVLLLPLVGRLWCTVCPLGWCNDLAARWGLKRAWPRKLQNLVLMGLLLLGLTLGAEQFSLNRYPDQTALLLAAVLVAATLAGLVFRGRVFCRYLCPVGGMIGLYSRVAPVEIGSANQEVCRRCESKACYYGSTKRYRLALAGRGVEFPLRASRVPGVHLPAGGRGERRLPDVHPVLQELPLRQPALGCAPPARRALARPDARPQRGAARGRAHRHRLLPAGALLGHAAHRGRVARDLRGAAPAVRRPGRLQGAEALHGLPALAAALLSAARRCWPGSPPRRGSPRSRPGRARRRCRPSTPRGSTSSAGTRRAAGSSSGRRSGGIWRPTASRSCRCWPGPTRRSP